MRRSREPRPRHPLAFEPLEHRELFAADAGDEWWSAWDVPVADDWTWTFDDSWLAGDPFGGSTGGDPWEDGSWWVSDTGFEAVDAPGADPAELDPPAAAPDGVPPVIEAVAPPVEFVPAEDAITVVPPPPADPPPTFAVASPATDPEVDRPTPPVEEAVAPPLDDIAASDETAAATVVTPLAPVDEAAGATVDDVGGTALPTDVPLDVRTDVATDDAADIPGDVVVYAVTDVPGEDLMNVSDDGGSDVADGVVIDDASPSDDPHPISVPIALDGGSIPPVMMPVTAPGSFIPPSASGSVVNRFAALGAVFFPGFGGSASATEGAAAGGPFDGQPGSGRPRLRLPIRPRA